MEKVFLREESVADYLSRFLRQPVHIDQIFELGGESEGAAALKQFGYGRPLCVNYHLNGQLERIVLRRINQNEFGREYASDCIGEVWREFHDFNRLPKHIKAKDLVMIDEQGRLRSAVGGVELLLVTSYADGRPYADDLLRISQQGRLQDFDLERAKSLAAYLREIHAVKHDAPVLWRRRLRDLVGHGEGIMGLTDSYPPDAAFVKTAELEALEQAANNWRWRLKPLSHRLSQVHGDFHPFNILFTEDNQFTLLDRSRGQWGEPADDVSCLVINYLFFSLQRNGKLSGSFERLYTAFWETYLTHNPDQELLSVIAPWFAWRALVLASPQWYPTLSNDSRIKLLTFAKNIMADSSFKWQDMNQYLVG